MYRLISILIVFWSITTSTIVIAAPYSAIVIDAKTGENLHAENQDTRLHPAGLTKLMTLYAAFSAIENGEVNLDDPALVSQNHKRRSASNDEIIEHCRLGKRRAFHGWQSEKPSAICAHYMMRVNMLIRLNFDIRNLRICV